jgi:AraC-like DNA-binding protein
MPLDLNRLKPVRAGRWLFDNGIGRWIYGEIKLDNVHTPNLLNFTSDELWINLVLRGRGRYRADNGDVFELKPGSLIQRFPRQKHSAWYDEDSGYAELFWGVDRTTSALLLDAGLVSRQKVLTIALDQGLIEEFKRLCERIASADDDDSRFLLHQAVAFQRGLYERELRTHLRGRWGATIAEAKALIDHDLAGSSSLDDIAARLGVSSATLRAEFRRILGESPAGYRIRKRMLLAQRLLLNQTVTRVARKVGYRDIAIFSKQFKKRCGMSPREYQRRLDPAGTGEPRLDDPGSG